MRQAELESLRAGLSEALGRPDGPSWRSEGGRNCALVGKLVLDSAPIYGGWALSSLLEHGGEDRILERRPAREMADSLRAMLKALELSERGRSERGCW
jgi:hypothetical protein